MPKELEQCVEKLIADPDFEPKEGEDRKSAAYAVCTAQLKESNDVQEEKKEMLENNQTIKRLVRFEADLLDETGKEWRIRVINAGTSKNKREYPLNVLHRDAQVF